MFHPTLIRNMTLDEKIRYGLLPEDFEKILDERIDDELRELKEEHEDLKDHLYEKLSRLERRLYEAECKNLPL